MCSSNNSDDSDSSSDSVASSDGEASGVSDASVDDNGDGKSREARGPNKDYVFERSFQCLVEAMQEIEKGTVRGQLWTRGQTYPTDTTTKINFSCRNYPRCPKKMQLHLDPSSVSYEYELSKNDQTKIKSLRCFMTSQKTS